MKSVSSSDADIYDIMEVEEDELFDDPSLWADQSPYDSEEED